MTDTDTDTNLNFELPAWGDAPPNASGEEHHKFSKPAQAPALALDLARVAMYLELIGRDGALYAADPATARPQTMQDSFILLFCAAHEPACWTLPRTDGDVPLRCRPWSFLLIAEAWAQSVYPLAEAARCLADAQALWDREHGTYVVPLPEKKTESQTPSMESIQTGSPGQSASSPEETGPADPPL